MKTKYTLYWLTGEREVIEGVDFANAMNQSGYGNGALPALDFYADGDNNDYAWNKEERKWEMVDKTNLV